MKLALIRKEAREHWVVLCLVLAFDAITLVGILVQAAKTGGRFSGLVDFVKTLGTMSALVAANRLFAREYAGRTQLFLEVLPIGRSRVWATKWLLGCAYVLTLTTAAWFATWTRALRTEIISRHDALLVLLSTGSFMLVVWCFASMAGMLGRHRYTAWIAITLIATMAMQHGKMRFDELPVARLLGHDVEMARVRLDAYALFEAWAFALVFTVSSALLALAGSGAIASALAEKMTARERVFLLVACVVGIFAYDTVDKGRTKQPYTVADAIYTKTANVSVGVLRRGELSDATAREMSQTIADDLEGMREMFGVQKVPPVYVLPKRSLDSRVVERAELEEKEGIVLRVAPDVVLSLLRMNVVHAALLDWTRQRAAREDRHELLDGFANWWVLRASPSEREQQWLRAAASRTPVTAASLTRWEETLEHVGDCVADGLAFATIDTLARRIGPAATKSLARELFPRPPDDVRVLFERSPAEHLRRAGVSWSELASATERERRNVIDRQAAALASSQQLTAAIAVKESPSQGAHIETGLTGANAFWSLYAVLGPWDTGQAHMSRLDVRGPVATLPLSAPRHARVLVAVESADAALSCPVRVAAKRITLP